MSKPIQPYLTTLLFESVRTLTLSAIGILLSIASSFSNQPLEKDFVCFGEVGLGGEIRSVSFSEKRIYEAKNLGFKTCLLPKNIFNSLSVKVKKIMKFIPVAIVDEAIGKII